MDTEIAALLDIWPMKRPMANLMKLIATEGLGMILNFSCSYTAFREEEL